MNRGRLIAAGIAVIVLLNAIAFAVRELAPEPSGPPSSSLATTPGGLAAWASLLERRGHPVRRLRERPADRLPAPSTTLVVADPKSLGRGDPEAIARFVRRGGRVVVAGRATGQLLARVTGGPVPGRATRGPRIATPGAGRAPEARDVGRVEAARAVGWRPAPRGLTPVLVRRGAAPLLVAGEVGRGRLLALADSSPLQNTGLRRADNAALALRLAGPEGRPDVFAESVHGFAPRSGLAALPGRWQIALGGLLLAALLGLLALGRRFGPPERADRELPPPRRAYVDAVAATLRRTNDPVAATAPLRAAARAEAARQAGLPSDATPAEIQAAATRLGLPPDEVEALGEQAGQDAVLAGGRALARLNGSNG
jgi:hypothetical protein